MNNSNINVLESILRAAGAEKYIENFKTEEIEASGLTLLSDEDLILLGIEEERVRKNLLNHCKTLQITTEKKLNLLVDKEYAQLILSQIYSQLNIHHANLACAVVREDVAISEVNLSNPTASLMHCIESMENQLEIFEKTVFPQKKGKKNFIKIFLSVAPMTIVLGYIVYRYVR